MKRLSSTKERVETRFFNCFSKIWKIKERYKAERIEERADLCPILILILKKEKEKLFQKYLVFLPTK